MSNPKPTRSTDRFQVLKEILLDDDQRKVADLEADIRRLQQQLAARDQLIELLEPVVVDVLNRKIENSKESISKTLAPVIGFALQHQIKHAREDIIDALYPIIGQLVKRSVADAMKNLVENINRNLERSFSIERWSQRVRARFARVDEAEALLAQSVPFDLESVFLIYRESGLLVAYHTTDTTLGSDQDVKVIGGMLTAIRSFMKSTFARDEEGDLDEIKYSDKTIRINPGRYSYLASVYTGVPRESFNLQLQKCHLKIHNKYYRQLREYDGDSAPLRGIVAPLRELFK